MICIGNILSTKSRNSKASIPETPIIWAISYSHSPVDKSAQLKINFLVIQAKHRLWALKEPSH